MRTTRTLLVLSALSVQAGCSYTPPPVTYVPPPAPSTYASLTCEEMAYKLAGYNTLLANVAQDQPTDPGLYSMGYQSQIQGLTNAIAQRGCSTTAASAAEESNATESFCLAVYVSRSVHDSTGRAGTGVITGIWQDKPLSTRPARAAFEPFQAFMASRGSSASLLPVGCTTTNASQYCDARSEVGDFTQTMHSAQVICGYSQLSADKGYSTVMAMNPGLTRVEWRPAGTVAPTASAAQPATPGSPPASVAPVAQAVPAQQVAPAAVGGPAQSPMSYWIGAEKPEKYRSRSCEYLQQGLLRSERLIATNTAEGIVLGTHANKAVKEVLASRDCPAAAGYPNGRLGADLSTVDPVKAARLGMPKTGVSMERINPGRPAEKAGAKVADVVVAVGATPIADDIDLQVELAKIPTGSSAMLTIWRSGNYITLAVELQAPPAGS